MAKNDYSAKLRQNIRVYALLRQYILAYCYVIYDMFKTIYNIIIYIQNVKYQLKKGVINATVNYIMINYVGESNTSVAFEMLEALQPGNNITWNLSYQRTLANNLQLTINYMGRKTEENNAIHTGGVQVRAFF